MSGLCDKCFQPLPDPPERLGDLGPAMKRLAAKERKDAMKAPIPSPNDWALEAAKVIDELGPQLGVDPFIRRRQYAEAIRSSLSAAVPGEVAAICTLLPFHRWERTPEEYNRIIGLLDAIRAQAVEIAALKAKVAELEHEDFLDDLGYGMRP